MENTILSFIKRHQLLSENSTVLVGVSGGPDSMALLHFLNTLRESWSLRLIAVSVDHGLRGEEARADFNYVRTYCEKQDIIFSGAFRDVPAYKAEKNIGTQVAAREMRYHFFREQMAEHKADYLALGHHGDDQAETMLMHLARTASSSSFSGIPAKRPFASGTLIRPLLCVAKSDIGVYLKRHQIIPRIDPSNEETNYTRNYFRKYVLPLLKEKNSNLHKTVQHLSESLQADEEFLSEEAFCLVQKEVQIDKKNKTAYFEIGRFKSRALPLQRRAYHLILNYLYDKLPENLSYIHEDDFFALLASYKSNARIDFPGCLKVEKAYESCRFYFQHEKESYKPFHQELLVPGKIVLPNGGVLTAQYTDRKSPLQGEHTYIFHPDEVAMPLKVRSRRQGDRMSWKGLKGTKKIKDIFIDAKIPRARRETWPLVTDNQGKILWLIGLRKRQPAEQREGAVYIQLTYKKDNAQEDEHA